MRGRWPRLPVLGHKDSREGTEEGGLGTGKASLAGAHMRLCSRLPKPEALLEPPRALPWGQQTTSKTGEPAVMAGQSPWGSPRPPTSLTDRKAEASEGTGLVQGPRALVHR